jgi:hypothetical protein
VSRDGEAQSYADDVAGGDAAELRVLYEQYATLVRPLITHDGDGTWRAQYPGVDWHVTADSEHAAAEALTAEALRRVDAGEPDAQPPHDILKRHLQAPIPGVYALDRELFVYLRTHLGHTATQDAFEEAERRRAAGRSYTMADYLHEKDDPPEA